MYIKFRIFRFRPELQAIFASILFAVSTPLGKLLLQTIEPAMFAGLLYLGSGFGLLIVRTLTKGAEFGNEASLSRSDIPWLIGATIAGGIIAPIALMYSLKITSAATVSLLLNFEGVATCILAAIMFRETIDRRVWIAIAAITAASVILTWDRSGTIELSIGALGILAACTFWGLDNNLTRRISDKSPMAIAIFKGVIAGSFLTGLAIVLRNSIPEIKTMMMALLLGFFAYGLSYVLLILAMRNLGTARACAYFGTSPFIGAIISFILFRELPDVLFVIAALLMVFGVISMLSEKHEHVHTHQEIEHEHGYVNGHHLHYPEESESGAHRHKHCAITHSHPHTPDIHHRHEH